MMRLVALLIMLATTLATMPSSTVSAAPAINLYSLSPSGDRAIARYDKDWVEIDLRLDGDARFLRPPEGCEWTSMAYAATTGDLAMVAFCAGPVRDCAAGSSRVLIRQPDGPVREVVSKGGGRWSGAYWHANQRRIVLIETLIKPPEVAGLSDLNRSVNRCGWHDATFTMVDVESRRVIGFDILPRGWRAKTIVSADHHQLTAVIAARTGVDDSSPAAQAIRVMCENRATAPAGLRAVCTGGGYDVLMVWLDGEWRLGFEDGDQTRHYGRVFATPQRETVLKEVCITSFSENLMGIACKLNITREGATQQIKALEVKALGGRFGDLALSGDGGVVVGVMANRSSRKRRFDVWDLETGEHRSLAPLLDPHAHFSKWPPEE